MLCAANITDTAPLTALPRGGCWRRTKPRRAAAKGSPPAASHPACRTWWRTRRNWRPIELRASGRDMVRKKMPSLAPSSGSSTTCWHGRVGMMAVSGEAGAGSCGDSSGGWQQPAAACGRQQRRRQW